ncbi:MAG: hypothetical protein IPO92_21095 [Saprospiraceae bacterium]|nr:hypothetical protein [Saprospiraceae bacterium]
MNTDYSLLDLLTQLNKWRKELIRASVAIVAVSIVGSFLLPNYYKSETTFYAASPDLAKPIPIGDDEKDVRIYGDDNDLDRLFTIAISNEILTYLIDTFDLYKHYDINKSDSKAKFKVKEELLDNYQTIKTKYGALELIVEDKDPIMAANIANAAREKIEKIAQDIVKHSQEKLISNYDVNLVKKQILSDSLAKRLLRIKKQVGIYDAGGQSGMYTKLLAESTSDIEDAKGKIIFYRKYPEYRDSMIKYMAMEIGANAKLAKANSELGRYAPVLSELRQMEQEQGRLHDQISLDKERLKQLSATFNAPFTALHIVEKAVIPVQKSRPKRAIIILISSLIGIMLSCLAIFVLENIRSIDQFKKR